MSEARFEGTGEQMHERYGCIECGDKTGLCTPTTCNADPSLDPAIYPQSQFDADHRSGMEDADE